jgi:hypothetical protein
MRVILDMSTGQKFVEKGFGEPDEPEFGSFEDQVLNAEWMRPELQLGLQPVVHRDSPPAETDAESFLKNVYRSQE